MKRVFRYILVVVVALIARDLSAADPFADGVRTTPWLSPADEQKAFKLHPGFEINLVAAEPDIQKPLNMQFDEQGRIWLTCSVEYPYAAKEGEGKDSIRVLEDTDGDGRFEKMTIFADGLNIPMGIYPWKGGCIAFTIPDIVHFEDTDGDGKSDKRTKLYGPFDTSRDTHGMCNAFRRGFDGWVYACHGFNNQSKVKGSDGHEIVMNSGNTFRFKLDGSRIENYTFGQVNPFGMCFDERFNIFTADCHSKPIYQLLRGGQYPGFGRKDDGLGFVPPMMDHLHGSTAICGLAIYSGDNFPEKYRGLFYSGNVMTSRINCNAAEYHGSTIRAKEQPDFLSTDDPWFRPVDIHIGPDGAMYILDFYNRIIGHYEVPLPHPGRDRTSGRIWRVVYKGDDPTSKAAKMPRALKGLSTKELLAELDNPNLQRRLQVQHYLTDVIGKDCKRDVIAYADSAKPQSPGFVHAIWALNALPKEAGDPIYPYLTELIEIHAAKMVTNRRIADTWNAAWEASADSPAFARRAWAEAAAVHPHEFASIKPLLVALNRVPKDDNHLAYTIRLALKNHIAALKSVKQIDELPLTAEEFAEFTPICLAVETHVTAAILLKQVETGNLPPEQSLAYLQHAAKNASGDIVARIAPLSRKQFADDLPLQGKMVLAIHAGLATRGEQPGKELLDWATELSTQLLSAPQQEVFPWEAIAIDDLPASQPPWVIQERASQDGDAKGKFFSSLPKGETLTGIYRSASFELPEKLSYWCAGHHGPTGAKPNDKNKILLRDAATKEVLIESPPSRNDVAQRSEWDLKKFAGRKGYIELVDGDTATGFAWLAVGRFSLDALNPVPHVAQQVAGAELAGKFKLATTQRARLGELLVAEKTDPAVRAAAGQAFVSFESQAASRALATALGSSELTGIDRQQLLSAINSGEEPRIAEALKLALRASPLRLQTLIAETLTSDKSGVEVLFALVKAGQASPRLLLLPAIAARFKALDVPKWKEQLAELTQGLPSDAEARDKLIAERRKALEKNMVSGVRGAELFTKHCANCHQIAGKGTVVGPQLDGIGLRGRDRILEDVLDPNRNVDVAFRTTTLQLIDGRVVSGLFRREEGALLVLVDPMGKEFTVPKADVEQRKQTQLSLMPANVGETITPADFADLATYLLEQKTAAKQAE